MTDKEIDRLFELLAKLDPHPREPETVEMKLDKPVEFRDGEERIMAATFTLPAEVS